MFTLNKYDTLFIDDYKGKKSLALGYIGRDGKAYPKKIRQEFGRENWKDSYFKIAFESDDQLREFAKWLMSQVSPDEQQEEYSVGNPPF